MTEILDIHRAKEKRFIDEANKPIKVWARWGLVGLGIGLFLAKIFFI